MPRFAVSHINWFDHDLTTCIVTAPDAKAALIMHPAIGSAEDFGFDLSLPMDEIKQQAFNMDAMIEVVEIP